MVYTVLPLYGRPNVSALHICLLKSQRDVVCLLGCRRGSEIDSRDHKEPCVEAIARTVSSPPPQTVNLNHPRSISKYDRSTALTSVSLKLMNKNPVERDSY